MTDLLGVPRNLDKDIYGQVIPVFRYILDTLLFEIRIPEEKVTLIRQLVSQMLARRATTLRKV